MNYLYNKNFKPGFLKYYDSSFLVKKISIRRLLLVLFVLLFTTPVLAAQTELIKNGKFSSGFSEWTKQGVDSWTGTTTNNNCRSCPYYAALGVNSSGWAKNDADGAFYQTVSIPANATTSTLSFWYYITTNETGSTAYDFLGVTVHNASGVLLETVVSLSNVNKTTGYVQKTVNMASYIGQTIRIRFGASTDESNTTTFRIDDVSIISITPSDTTAPTANISSPCSSSCNSSSSSITVSGSATDSGGSGLAQITVSNSTNGSFGFDANVSGNSSSFSVSGITLNQGQNTIYAQAYDGAGNYSFDYIYVTYNPATAPTVSTGSAASVTSSSATINGTVNPNGLSTTYYFQYSQTLPYVGTPSGTNIGTGTSVLPQSKSISNLYPNSLYYYRIVAQNSAGTSYGSDMTFTTSAAAPSATTGVSVPTVTGAMLYGFFNPNGSATNAWYEWGTSTSCQNGTSCENSTSPKPIGSETSVVQDSEPITNLTPGATYYFRAAAQNSAGTTKGDIVSFTMPATTVPPTVTTGAVINVYTTFVSAEGIVNPNGAPLTAWFEYGTSLSYGDQTDPVPYNGTGTNDITMNDHITSLTIGTRYYYRIVAKNSAGRSEGASQTFIHGSSTVNGFETPAGYEGDPVNTSTGNYSFQRKDIEIPGRNIPFVFERTYNSQNTQKGPLGLGWNHSYNIRLKENTINADVTVFWGDGKSEIYTSDGAGGFTPPNGVFNTLIDNGDSTYTLIKKDLTKYNFNVVVKEGTLSSIVDKNWNTVSLTYTGNNLTKITDTVGREVNLTYDTNNRIELITDPISRIVQFTYDGSGDLVTSKDMNGNWTNYTYDSNHQMLTIVDPRGNTIVSNTYDSLNRVDYQFNAKNKKTDYTYDEVNKVTTITNPLLQNSYHYYDDKFRLIQEKDALGNSMYYTYAPTTGNRTEVKDKNDNITKYEYNGNGNVTKKIDALLNTTNITYDSNNPLSRTDALLKTTQYEYDANSNLTKTIDPLDNFTSITYNSYGQPQVVTDKRLNPTTNIYDSSGNLTEVTDAYNKKTIFTYDGVGRMQTKKDALNRTTYYTYDNNDNLLSIKDPLNGITQYDYDENNNKHSMTDPMGNTTDYSYDANDLLETIIGPTPFNYTVVYSYDELDRKKTVQDKRGNITSYDYDEAGNLTKITDTLLKETNFTYDPNGNKLTESNPLQQVTTYTYDELNRVITIKDHINNITTNTYDELGRLISVKNAKNQTTSFEYDKLGRLTKVTDDNNGTVQYTYDENGNRLSMIDPKNNETTYTYDELNRLISKVEPLNNTTQYQYDEVGNLKQITYPNGNTIQYSYDVLNRLTTKTYPDSTTVTFNYDANGNRIEMIDSLGTTSYQYDELNRMTSCTDSFNKTVGYGYDENGNRITTTYPDNKMVDYTYDKLNRLATVTDWLTNSTTYTYDATGNLTNTLNPNNTTVVYTYDSAGRLTGLSNKKSDSTVISSYSYTLDEIGNHTQSVQEEPLIPIVPDQNVSYTYDAENRLTDVNSTANTFDANGNMTGKGSDTYTYDYEDRLIQSTIGGVVTQYRYDGNGNRFVKVEGGTTTRYVLDINGSLSNVLAETDGSGNITTYYVYGLGLISKILPDGTDSYYHYDSRGSTIALTDAGESITDKYAYDPFGKLANSTGPTTNPFKYVGSHGVQDEGNGLQYVRARYYASEIGRFITKDPQAGSDKDGQSLNRYVYALNNPIVLIDISGFSAQEGGSVQSNSGSSDSLHNRYVDSGDRIKQAFREWQKAQIESDFMSDLYIIELGKWINIFGGVEEAGNTAIGMLRGGPRGAISGLLQQTSTLTSLLGHPNISKKLDWANFFVSSAMFFSDANKLNQMMDMENFSLLTKTFGKQLLKTSWSGKGWWNSVKRIPVSP